MRFLSWLKGLKSDSARQHQPLARINLSVEALEDRCMPSFLGPVNYAAGTNTQAVLTADFNGDGRPDLAVANYASSNVSVLLGNADGTFQSAQNSATGAYPRSLAVGDFNTDGKLDLASANSGDVSVLLGNGDGTFQAPASLSVYTNPASVAVGDFNADGKLDLGVTSNAYIPGSSWYYWYPGYYQSQANVLLGTGTGSFAAPLSTDLGSGFREVAVAADFTGDGKLDFATALTDYGSVTVLPGNGTGTFGAPVYSSGPVTRAMTAGDLNGDGKLDLVTANSIGNGVSVMLGNGLGAFSYTSAQIYSVGSVPSSVAIADLNGDGKPDLLATDYNNNVNVLLGNGAGSFRPPVNVAAGAGAAAPVSIAVGDFNGDGRPDVATANSLADNVSVLLNNGVWAALTAPSITVSDVTVTEGNLGTKNATFNVSLSAASTQIVTVHYETADASATVAGGDYQVASGTVTFNPGETSKPVIVLVNGDRLVEFGETFYLRVNDPSNAFVADPSGVGTILDDEPHVSIDYGPVVVTEGNTGTINAVFTVRLAAIYDVPVSVNFSTFEGDTDFPTWGYYGYYAPPPAATSGSDFQARSGTLTFAAGETSKPLPIVVNGDLLGEADEYFSVNLSDPTIGTIDSGHAVGLIVDDEPIASINSVSGVEGNTGTTTLTFTVTLSAAPASPVTVTYATTDGSATVAGGDYQAKTGTVTFAAGEMSKPITVLVNGDRLGENDEYLYVNLTSATGARLGASYGNGTIVDNEPRLSINNVSITEGNKGTKLMTFTVTLSLAYDQVVTVQYATNDWNARAGEDYVATAGTLTFAKGQTTKSFTVTIKGDTKKESDENFFVSMSNASSNAVISYYAGNGLIVNDDGDPASPEAESMIGP